VPEARETLADEESRSWFKTLPPAKRAAIRELMRVRPINTLVALLFVGMWVASGVLILAVPGWPAHLAGYLVIAFAIHGMANLLHEAIHGNLFRNRTLDYWMGLLSGAASLQGVTAYKAMHLPHHWYNRTERDPGELMNLSKNGKLLSLVFYLWIFVGMFFVILTMPFASMPWAQPRERRLIAVEYCGILAVIAGLVLLGLRFSFLGAVVELWGIPLLLAGFIGNVRGWAEHMLTLPGHVLTQSRTVTSNRLVSFLFLNANYHLEHHLFPGMPWYNLPKLHALLQEDYRAVGTFTYKSYVRFMCDAVIIGVHGLAPKHVRLPPRLMAQAGLGD
jgi:fatty acid desaturase